MSDEDLDSNSSDDPQQDPRTSLEEPAFYRHFTSNFLKALNRFGRGTTMLPNFTPAQLEQLLSFKRRYGKYALCDAMIRVKVFLSLDRDFRFTNLDDMLHECKAEYRSAKELEKIYLKYMRDNPSLQTNANNSSTVRGSVYNFLGLPEPRVRNPSTTLLERSFQKIIQKGFGVILPAVNRDVCLYKFYQRYSYNMHNVLRFAKLRSKEKLLKNQMQGLKNGILGCRQNRRNG